MTSSQNPLQGLVLTPQQQNLLFAALNSNRPSDAQPTNGFNMSTLQFDGSPIQPDGMSSFQNSPDLDYDYDFAGADSSFDYYDDAGQAKMIGDLPGSKRALKSESGDAESPEKRSHPDEEEEGPGAKRRESEEKLAKKPGRKPLTTEPTSKRKAQNRAAQRAFRERKEKHLKDLETKVQELEKLSEDANNEKEALRAQVDKMTVELNEYKKRLSMLSGGRPVPQGPASAFGSLFVNNLNDVNFQFEFPKFGSLPGPPINKAKKPSPTQSQSSKRGNSDHRSPSESSQRGVSPGNSSSYSQVGLDSQSQQDLASLSSELFTPPLNNGQGVNGSSISLDSHYNMGGATSTSSPSASSNSNMGGPNSSCGTSPESFAQSPMGFKPLDTLSTIGEEHPSLGNPSQGPGHFGNAGIEDFTQWLPQNDFQFDPELFGGYRDPQENVLSQGFDEGFFNDAVDIDFLTPYNLPIPSPAPPKKDLISQIDAAKDADEPATTNNVLLQCNDVWEKIQNCPKAKGGDFDLDGLCADLQKKAKCDGTGPVVSEKDFQRAIKKYLCKEEQAAAEADAFSKETQTQS
ncbi:transcription factor PAP1-domain-containing protein [Chaetomium fimeti]|uniref:Transcription factor PAP1-domain-containing protein n=1 Tax=Chaetomium fimeti TaxID=1854472 RepID=A0AAE0HA37_9PEZI|nr:transcription factor PAP1-domain-containing protein [Chaetomium fimeti]